MRYFVAAVREPVFQGEDDLVWVPGADSYHSIIHKTYAIFDHAVNEFNPNFVMKAVSPLQCDFTARVTH